MKINKSLDIDLNIISPQKHIRIHEGDVDSVDILIGVTVDDESVDLDGVTIKYDATINNYLAEQDANGSVVDDKISIPVTQNMTAMSGLLLIDVRMIQNDQILFTQTICATVEKAVVNGSTYIDFDKITIVQRMNALEEKMDYIEELVENFDTSKLIVSANRPPMGAPAEVDVDLLRVGDTWILSGASIVYKLVEAQYNYQPVPSAEPYHKFTWQPLNERYGVGNTEPPTTVTYQAVIYTINEAQWSWLPVPEYFKGDHYQMQLGVDDPTYYICKSASMPSTGVCTYTWREEGGGASSGITIINTETVPESAEWGDSIPASYAGNTGKAGEIAYWEEDGYFWGLCSLATDPITGNINYSWVRQADEIDISDLKASIATKMKLAPLNPTAEQIAALPAGQLYGDTANHKGTIKGGQEFYDSTYVDENLQRKTYFGYRRPECYGYEERLKYKIGDRYYCESDKRTYVLNQINESAVPPMYFYEWGADSPYVTAINGVIPHRYYTGSSDLCQYVSGDIVFQIGSGSNAIIHCYVLQSVSYSTSAYQDGITFTYLWREIAVPYNHYTKTETNTLLADKMSLAPLNPTAEQIAAMLSGQLYSDTVNHKGVIKGGQEFYDTGYIDNVLRGNQKRIFFERPKGLWQDGSTPPTHDDGTEYENGDLFFYQGILFKFYTVQNIPHFGKLNWYERVGNSHLTLDYRPDRYTPPSRENAEYTNTYYIGDELCVYTRSGGNDFGELKRIFKCVKLFLFGTPGDYYYSYDWEEIPLEIYSKTEINTMIGDIETALSEV